MAINPKIRVSIVITCYNYGKYISQAIDSVLSQTYKNIELIIIDDGSTDDSLETIRGYRDRPHVTVVTRENRGVVFTRNEALRLAKGDFLVQLDADDYLDDDYIEVTLACAIKNKSDIVYTNFKKFDAETETSDFPKYSLEELKNHNFIHISSLVRTSAVGEVRFDEELSDKTHEDWDFFLSLAVKGVRATLCKDTFLHYRIHRSGRNNIMKSHDQRLLYTSVYSYITKKHIQAGRPGFDYLIGAIFADWYKIASDEIVELEKRQDKLVGELNAIQSSKKYRVLLWVAKLMQWFKR